MLALVLEFRCWSLAPLSAQCNCGRQLHTIASIVLLLCAALRFSMRLILKREPRQPI